MKIYHLNKSRSNEGKFIDELKKQYGEEKYKTFCHVPVAAFGVVYSIYEDDSMAVQIAEFHHHPNDEVYAIPALKGKPY